MLSSRFTFLRSSIYRWICIAFLSVFGVPSFMPGARLAAPSKAKPSAKPGSAASFRDCKECPEMVTVPAGSFTMGSPENEPERQIYEGPQHKVTIAKPFAVGKFAVTFAEWDACVAAGGCGAHRPGDQGWGRGDRPVINVSWNDAKSYLDWLSRKTAKRYRLLSEAEREYVTRAGSTAQFWWGPTITPDQANYDGTASVYAGGAKGKYTEKTVPVKSYQPNPFGLYQVHGNVWEWVEDCWNDNYDGAPADGSAWITDNCSLRVLRGGSWGIDPRTLRAAFRSRYFSTFRDAYTGFRIARSVNP